MYCVAIKNKGNTQLVAINEMNKYCNLHDRMRFICIHFEIVLCEVFRNIAMYMYSNIYCAQRIPDFGNWDKCIGVMFLSQTKLCARISFCIV